MMKLMRDGKLHDDRACRQGERVLARVIGVGSSCRTGVLFSSCRSWVLSCRTKNMKACERFPCECGEAKSSKFTKGGAHPIVLSRARALAWVGTLARTC